MADLSVTLAGIPLTTCVYNASGPRTGSSAAMSKIAKSASGGVLAKSATVASQKGNDLPRCVCLCALVAKFVSFYSSNSVMHDVCLYA